MIIEESECSTKKCCVFDKPCIGSSCMAWVPFYKEVYISAYSTRLPTPPRLEKTTGGSCGLVKH